MLSKHNDSILSVMQCINDSAMGISFILDDNDKLCGIVTDGDIRRSILKGFELYEEVGFIFNIICVSLR